MTADKHQGFSNEDVVYLIFADRFCDGNPSNNTIGDSLDQFTSADLDGRKGGDIEGIISKLDYLKDLGVSALWITPMLENNMWMSYHGYAATDLYKSATALAVEITVLHNFIWHERWTWADRKSASVRDTLWRLLRFNSSNGAVSIVGNVVFMRFLVGTFGIPVLVANGVSIVLCSLLNFVLSDRFVFARGHPSFPQRGLCSHGELGQK